MALLFALLLVISLLGIALYAVRKSPSPAAVRNDAYPRQTHMGNPLAGDIASAPVAPFVKAARSVGTHDDV